MRADPPGDISPQPRLGRTAQVLGWIGVLIGISITGGLAFICTFNEGELDPEWVGCLFWIFVAAVPQLMALLGLRHQHRGMLLFAGVVAVLVGFVSFLLVPMLPALFYWAAAVPGRPVAGATPDARNP